MSTVYYYNDGVGASAQMKADLKRVRLAKPDRYVTRQVTEQRHSVDGGTLNIQVNREPDAIPMSARQRHDFWTRRAK
jgi:hypothetical protein